MKYVFHLLCALAAITTLSCAVIELAAQSDAISTRPQGRVILTKLVAPKYPPVAKQARITGEVELNLNVLPNGVLRSVDVVRGHPLLMRAALESAQQSQFDCKDCVEGVATYRLWYTFQLDPAKYCTETASTSGSNELAQHYPEVTQSQNRVTLVDRPVGTCDMAGRVSKQRARSAKCLYLWKCGLARLTSFE